MRMGFVIQTNILACLEDEQVRVNFLLDMDATECEKKRVEYIDDLTDLEKQFAILREQ